MLSGKARGLSQLSELSTGVGYAAARRREKSTVRRSTGPLFPTIIPSDSRSYTEDGDDTKEKRSISCVLTDGTHGVHDVRT